MNSAEIDVARLKMYVHPFLPIVSIRILLDIPVYDKYDLHTLNNILNLSKTLKFIILV